MAEFSVLEKPVVTFKVAPSGRFDKRICDMIADLTHQIETPDQLDAVVERLLHGDNDKLANQRKWNRVFFEDLSVSHTDKAYGIISDFLSETTSRS